MGTVSFTRYSDADLRAAFDDEFISYDKQLRLEAELVARAFKQADAMDAVHIHNLT